MLTQFRDLAERLREREKIPILITFDDQEGKTSEIKGKIDPLFATIELQRVTVPCREVKSWLHVLYGANPKTVKIAKEVNSAI